MLIPVYRICSGSGDGRSKWTQGYVRYDPVPDYWRAEGYVGCGGGQAHIKPHGELFFYMQQDEIDDYESSAQSMHGIQGASLHMTESGTGGDVQGVRHSLPG